MAASPTLTGRSRRRRWPASSSASAGPPGHRQRPHLRPHLRPQHGCSGGHAARRQPLGVRALGPPRSACDPTGCTEDAGARRPRLHHRRARGADGAAHPRPMAGARSLTAPACAGPDAGVDACGGTGAGRAGRPCLSRSCSRTRTAWRDFEQRPPGGEDHGFAAPCDRSLRVAAIGMVRGNRVTLLLRRCNGSTGATTQATTARTTALIGTSTS